MPRTESSSFPESYPIPSLKTIRTFSICRCRSKAERLHQLDYTSAIDRATFTAGFAFNSANTLSGTMTSVDTTAIAV